MQATLIKEAAYAKAWIIGSDIIFFSIHQDMNQISHVTFINEQYIQNNLKEMLTIYPLFHNHFPIENAWYL